MPSLIKRIQNLWKLSAYEPNEDKTGTTLLPAGTKVVQQIIQKPAMAQIIKRITPIDNFLKTDE